MQRFAVEIKGPVWARLKDIYKKYTQGEEFISVSNLSSMVKEVLREESPSEIDYVIRNINRIDTDNSGTISFEEFGNFLLKRHCGEMALQKMHRNNRIKNGSQRKVNLEEFGMLLNEAYEFLGVHVDEVVVAEIFNNVDGDKDGLITYAEYFGFTDIYLLNTTTSQQKVKAPVEKIEVVTKRTVEASEPAKEYHSRLRKFLITGLKRIFESYDRDSNNLLDNEELKVLLRELFGVSETVLNSIMGNHFRPDTGGRFQSFDVFVVNFLNYASDLGWFRVSRDFPKGKTSLSLQEFLRLVEEAFKNLNINRVNRDLLLKFFDKLDTNRDGLVELADFKTWISRFLSPKVYFGPDYRIPEDDESSTLGKDMIGEEIVVVAEPPAPQAYFKQRQSRPIDLTESQISVTSTRSGRLCKFTFSSLDLSKRVRRQLILILQKLDKNRDRQFEEHEIVEALQILMKSDKNEVLYVVANVFRYDKDGDKIVTYDELANFFLEYHFGEMAIQRLHKEDVYVRGAQRMMNMNQFVRTLDYALSFVDIEAYEGELETLFEEVDLNRDGWITYQEYFEFLIHYFGSESAVARREKRNRKKSLYDLTANKGQEIPPEERLSRLIRTQIRVMFIEFDRNRNTKFERAEALSIAKQVLDQTDEEASKTLSNVFSSSQEYVEYDTLINRLLEIHTTETILLRLHKQGVLKSHRERTLDFQDFVVLLNTAFINVSVLPTKDQYMTVFNRISTSEAGTGRISYRQYQHFVARYFGKSEDKSFSTSFEQPPRHPQTKKSFISSSEYSRDRPIVNEIYSSLRSIYETYDRVNQGLERNAYEEFIQQALGKSKKQNVDYILWAVYRVDQNSDGRISLKDSVFYVLRLQAELALQDFHYPNPLIENKERLGCNDFVSVVRSSYPFCESLGTESLASVFQRLDSDNDGYISDRDFLSWINFLSKACVQG